jgi:reactive intermediate/imine deaminase
MKTTVATQHAPAAIGTYSQAVKVSGNLETVYLSGQIPLDPQTMTLVEGFDNQVKQVFENLKAVAEAAGGSLNHLVKVNVYLLDLAHFAKVNEVMAQYIQAPYPARAAVAVAGLPRGAEVEIEGVMVIDAAQHAGG